MLGAAARRGLIPANPMTRLEAGERPAVGRRDQRILERAEIGALIDATPPKFRVAVATAAFTGLRVSELLGLTWGDLDLDGGFVRVRKQLGRDGRRVEPKTAQAKRDVVLMPALGRLLREHKLGSRHSLEHDLVFASERGTGLLDGNLRRRGFAVGVEAAGLNKPDAPRLRLHDLRHTFASLLISGGADVVTVSRQLGHASPNVTLGIYAHMFDASRHAERTRGLLEREFGVS